MASSLAGAKRFPPGGRSLYNRDFKAGFPILAYAFRSFSFLALIKQPKFDPRTNQTWLQESRRSNLNLNSESGCWEKTEQPVQFFLKYAEPTTESASYRLGMSFVIQSCAPALWSQWICYHRPDHCKRVFFSL
jgi:hypothetical protein